MEIFVARQPIFDSHGELFGYELLYRRTGESRGADGDDALQMSRDVVVRSFLEIGLESITAGALGFLNFSREMLVEDYGDLLPKERVVIEVLETIAADDEVVAACARLRKRGFQIALDDWAADGTQDALLPFADIIKIDVLNRGADELEAVLAPLRGGGARLLAERVETAEVREQCRALGFDLFQGYFFSRPEIVAKRGTSVEQMAIIDLMNLLHDETATDQQIEDTFRRDPTLSYKLLRIVNAAASGMRSIESIQHGVRLLGRGVLRRWLGLLLASSLAGRGGTNLELVNTAVQRARFLEQLAAGSGHGAAAAPLFMVGLFSMMDALLQTPMEEIVERISLSDEARAALLGEGGPYARWLQLVGTYEAGEWEGVEILARELEIAPEVLSRLYLESLQWARERVMAAKA